MPSCNSIYFKLHVQESIHLNGRPHAAVTAAGCAPLEKAKRCWVRVESSDWWSLPVHNGDIVPQQNWLWYNRTGRGCGGAQALWTVRLQENRAAIFCLTLRCHLNLLLLFCVFQTGCTAHCLASNTLNTHFFFWICDHTDLDSTHAHLEKGKHYPQFGAKRLMMNCGKSDTKSANSTLSICEHTYLHVARSVYGYPAMRSLEQLYCVLMISFKVHLGRIWISDANKMR